MKKSTIWILAGIMAFAFFGLLYLQITYLRESIRIRSDQFNEIINRSLLQVSRSLELDQTQKYLNEAFLENQKKQAAAYNRSLSLQNQMQEETVTHQQRVKMTAPDMEINMELNMSTTTQTPKSQIFQSPSKSGTNAISKTIFGMQDEQKKKYL